jgi:hypothetical protein
VIAIINLLALVRSVYGKPSNVAGGTKKETSASGDTATQSIAVCPTKTQSFVSVGDGLEIGAHIEGRNDRRARRSVLLLRPLRAKEDCDGSLARRAYSARAHSQA